jgi:hypothetical protein
MMDSFGCFEFDRKKLTEKFKAGGGDFHCLLVKLSLPERLICLDSANTLMTLLCSGEDRHGRMNAVGTASTGDLPPPP